MTKILRWSIVTALSLVLTAAGAFAQSSQKLTREQAGEIGLASGQIAFIRDGDVWTMDASGKRQQVVCEVKNADGRVSWAPDNRHIIFTRSGTMNLEGPDGMGGFHKVYDLFLCYLDSVDAGRINYWMRLTSDLGNRDAQWYSKDLVVFTKDVNAYLPDADLPNYQVATMKPDGTDITILRRDFQTMNEFFLSPSMSKDGHIAFVHMYKAGEKSAPSPQGIAVLHRDSFMVDVGEIRQMSKKHPKAAGPAWSPDGKWIAYARNDINKPGIYLMTPDLSKSYLVFEPPVGTYCYTLAPSFSPDSKWLTFATTDGSVWISDITGSQTQRLTGPGQDKAPAWSK